MSFSSINANPQEIAKFDALASRWWDINSEFKALHEINPLRLDYISRHTPGGLAGKRIVDVGCGGGILAESMALQRAQVVGIDLAEAPLTVARLHRLETQTAQGRTLELDYRQITAEQLAEQEATSFEVVTCLEMLEHVPDPAAVVQACSQLVKPGGQVFFSTLNRSPKAYLLAIIGAEYLLRLLPIGTHDYAQFIRPAELDAWSRAVQLKLRDSTGLHYNPLSKTYALAPGLDVNYLAHYHLC